MAGCFDAMAGLGHARPAIHVFVLAASNTQTRIGIST
jgi:hypothetical protein